MDKLHAQMMKDREDVVDACVIFTDKKGDEHGPCERIDGTKCSAYMLPKAKWRLGRCPLASHWFDEKDQAQSKVRVGQQKQTKH